MRALASSCELLRAHASSCELMAALASLCELMHAQACSEAQNILKRFSNWNLLGAIGSLLGA